LTRRAEIRLSGVEFTQMGQRGILGRYPVHFHIQHDARCMKKKKKKKNKKRKC